MAIIWQLQAAAEYSRARRIAGVILCFLLFSSGAHATYSNLVVFGDSLSDTGNINTLYGTIAPPYYDGRYSNGPIYVDVMANALGLSSLNSLSGGTNYAYGGATTSTMMWQYQDYLNSIGNNIDPLSLFVVWGGGNDLLGNQTVEEGNSAATRILGIVDDLLTYGAQSILVMNLPNFAGAATTAFNSALNSSISALGGSNVLLVDVASLYDSILSNPLNYGFTNVYQPCLNNNVVCSNPDAYLLWDTVHPTSATHQLIGNLALQTLGVVPVPGTAWLFGSALLGLFGTSTSRLRK